jgi:predicted phage terminase large subunit-like protein
MSVDASFKDTVTSARCSIQVWGKKLANYYMVDNVTELMSFTATLKTIENLLAKYPKIGAKYVEDKANGTAIINVMNQKLGGFIPVKADTSTGGKVARAHAVEPWVTSGNVLLPRGQTWVHDYVEEMAAFPNGTYADQVDASTQALNKLIYFNGEIEKMQNNVMDFFGHREKPQITIVEESFINYGSDEGW